MPHSVAELHAIHASDRSDKPWLSQVPFEAAAELAGDLHTQADPVAYLDAIDNEDHTAGNAVNQSLLALPPKALLENFGDEVAIWASVNSVYEGYNNAINASLELEAGYRIADLEAARLWSWQKHYRHGAKEIIAQYRLMQSMREGLVDQIDLPKILVRNALGGIALSNSRIDQYSLIPIEIKRLNTYQFGGGVKGWYGDYNETLAYHMYLDAPTGFALTYKDLPNAMGGIAMNGLDELSTYQIQGVQGKRVDPDQSDYPEKRYIGRTSSRGLAPLDWKKAIVEVAEGLAALRGVGNVGIQSAENNPWTRRILSNETSPHLDVEAAKRTYDETAERLGYERDPADEKGNWHKPLAA